MTDQKSAVQEEHRCLSCGGTLRFDPEMQTLMCADCDANREPEVSDEAKAPGCPNCGAELTLITGSRQASCASCDSTFQMLQDGEDCGTVSEIPENHRYIAPFTVSKEEYQKGMITWLAHEKGTPTDAFEKLAMIRSSEGLYVPYYYCVVSYNVKWTASVGHDRMETYTAFERRRDSQGNTTTVPVTRTRVVTDWHSHSATASGRVTLGMEASSYLAQVYQKLDATNTKESLAGIKDSKHGRFESASELEIDTQFQHYRLQGNQVALQPLDAKYTASFQVLPCDVQAGKVYNKQEVHNQISKQIERNAPGDRIRGLEFHGDIIPDYFLIYRPYWASVYTYDKKICASHSDGANAERHYGTRPIDKGAKKLASKFFLPFKISLLLFVPLVVVMLIMGDASYDFIGVAGGVLGHLIMGTGIFGLIARSRLKRKNKQIAIENSKDFLGNPSKVFQRKSATADPTANIDE